MPTVFLTHTSDMLANYYGPRPLEALRALCDVRLNETGKVLDDPAELAAFLRVAIDIRNIDVAAASKAGILVTHATAGFIASVVEQTFGFMINHGRHLITYANDYHAGKDPQSYMGRQLSGATLGVIGYGAIGEHLARVGVAFGMKVLVSDPFKTVTEPGTQQVSFEDLLAQSDFVVCLAIANEQTENMMNAAAFARMKKTAQFVNMSRGNLVDEQALAAALDAKQIAGAAMDVGRAMDQKPSLFLARRADVLASPHTAGLTPDAAEHQAFDTVNQVKEILAGRMPPNAANGPSAHRLGVFTNR